MQRKNCEEKIKLIKNVENSEKKNYVGLHLAQHI